MRLLLGLLLVLISATASAQVPPPPLPPGFRDLSAGLTEAFNRRDIAAYTALLAPDLKVFNQAVQIASNRQDWLSTVKKLQTAGAVVRPVGVVSEWDGSFFVMDQITLGERGGGRRAPAIWWGRVIGYKTSKGKITDIRFLSGYSGGYPLLKPNSQQMGPHGE